jgi:preprotein translocase subunit SecF
VTARLAPDASLDADQARDRIDVALRSIDPAVDIKPLEYVGPQVGEELRNSAILALLLTLLLVFMYIAVRFHTWRLSTGAILALIHDPVLILGWFALMQTPFDLAVVAALLAVVGYSLNDTIIVFDRIRERFEANRKLVPVVALDQSINQTLSRTIMTKVTTLIVVVALLVLGGPVLNGFSQALVVGILVGTYSSIYISSAVALDLGLKAEHVFPEIRSREADSLP